MEIDKNCRCGSRDDFSEVDSSLFRLVSKVKNGRVYAEIKEIKKEAIRK